MMWFQLLFFTIIALAAIVRISILPKRVWIPIVVCWGILSMSLTLYMSGLTPDETIGLLRSKSLVVYEFVELMLFVAMVFSSGRVGRITGYYPGIMILVPIALLSSIACRSFPGLDFMVPALVAGASVCVVSASLVFLCRYLRLGKGCLYRVSLFGILICIIYYGMP